MPQKVEEEEEEGWMKEKWELEKNGMKNKFETEMQENNTLCSQMLFINISIQDIFIYSHFTFQKLLRSLVRWV